MPARKPLKFPVTLDIEMSPEQVADWSRDLEVNPDDLTPGQLLDAVREDVTRYLDNLVKGARDGEAWTARLRAPRPRRTERAGYGRVSADQAVTIAAMRGSHQVREIATALGIPKSTVQHVLTEDDAAQRRRQGYAV
jgi:hypothetical protein